MINITKMLRDIELAYGSLTKPSYHFVEKANHVFAETFIHAMRREGYKVEETTDLNDDIAFTFYVAMENYSWTVQISIIGMYCIVMEIDSNGKITFNNYSQTAILEGLLQNFGATILTKSDAEHRINFGDNNSKKSLYSILFTDTDSLPWEAIPLHVDHEE